MRQRHETILRQFCFASIGDGDLRRTLHVHAAVISGKGMTGKTIDQSTALDAPDTRAPSKLFERPVDIRAHGIGGIDPQILRVVTCGCIFLKIELIARICLGAIRQSAQESRHSQANISGILRVP